MNMLGNIIWLIFGGLIIAIEYILAGVLLCLTIVGIPFGYQVIKIGFFTLFPFGYQTISLDNDIGLGCLNLIMNIIWIICGGIWIALTHLFFGIILCMTIIGIPWGLQHFKLVTLALAPFGRSIEEI